MKAADHAIQLTKQFGSVANAALPDLYVQAKAGLAQCVRVDECKSWSDKAEAIRSYARQANDEELMHTAMRIKGRAVERLGALLEELEKSKGGRPRDEKQGEAPDPVSPRQRAVSAAEISEHQAKQAQAVARFAKTDPERYEAMVDAPKPATVTELAREGRKPAPAPKTDHLRGATPKDFARTTVAQGEIRDMARMVESIAPALVAQTAADHEREAMLQHLAIIGPWVKELTQLLGGKS